MINRKPSSSFLPKRGYLVNILYLGNKTTNNGQQPPTTQSNNSGWGQPGPKSQTNNSITPTSQSTPSSTSQNNNGPSSNTKQQLEQLNSMREAIFSQDGWGGVSTLFCFVMHYVLLINL